MNNCKDCGTRINDNYIRCYTCNEKTKQNKKQEENQGIDLQKEIKLPLWTLAIIFIGGVMLGAWLF